MIALKYWLRIAPRFRLAIALYTCLVLLSASHRASAEVAGWDKVIAAAKAEGGLVLYTALLGVPSTKAIAKAFEAKYGIPVQVLEARASELRERIRTEQAAGRFLGDVMFNSENQALILSAEDKSIVPHEPVPNAAGLTEPFRDDGLKSPVMTINYGLLVNNRLVPPGEEPKSWRDLTDPKWKGKILSDDMRAVGGGYVLFYVTEEKLGNAYHEALATQDIRFTREQREAAKARRARRNGHLHAVQPRRHSEPQRPSGSRRDAGGRRALCALCGGGHEGRAASECRAPLYRFHDVRGGSADLCAGWIRRRAP